MKKVISLGSGVRIDDLHCLCSLTGGWVEMGKDGVSLVLWEVTS